MFTYTLDTCFRYFSFSFCYPTHDRIARLERATWLEIGKNIQLLLKRWSFVFVVVLWSFFFCLKIDRSFLPLSLSLCRNGCV